MADFESIIRPYQTVDISPPQRVIATGTAAPANVVLVIGKGGGIKSLGASFNSQLNTYMDKQQKEVTTPAPAT